MPLWCATKSLTLMEQDVGRSNRRDVYVRTDGVIFEVEIRLGGSERKR
jgi:hypothetical protein